MPEQINVPDNVEYLTNLAGQLKRLKNILEEYDWKYMQDGELQSDIFENLLDDISEIIYFSRIN